MSKIRDAERTNILLVSGIKCSWDAKDIIQLFETYRPLIERLKGKLSEWFSLSSDEVEGEVKTQLLQMVNDFDLNYCRSGVPVADYAGVYFTHYISRGLPGRTMDYLTKLKERGPLPTIVERIPIRHGIPDMSSDNVEFVQSKLSELHSRVYQLYYVHEYSQNEVAEILQVSQPSVSIMVIQIRRVFVEFYENIEGFTPEGTGPHHHTSLKIPQDIRKRINEIKVDARTRIKGNPNDHPTVQPISGDGTERVT